MIADLEDRVEALEMHICDGASDPKPEFCPRPIRLVFITEFENGAETWTGDLGGLAGADAKCNAAGGGLGNYRAWLSTAMIDAKDRIPDAHYVNTLDQTVALNKNDLLDGNLTNRILRFSDTDDSDPGALVWTNTTGQGNTKNANFSCSNWTSGDINDSGAWGFSGATDGRWTDDAGGRCALEWSLYCFQIDLNP